jgi:hypothetical protein
MASQEEIQSRIQGALQLLAGGVDVSTAVYVLQERHNISQRTSYRAVKDAEKLQQLEDDAPAEEESTPQQRSQSIVNMLELRMMRAIDSGTDKELTAVTKALDAAKKWQGYALATQDAPRIGRYQD